MINTKEDFLLLVKQIEQKANYKKPYAFGITRLDRGQLNKDKILQASFTLINYEQSHALATIILEAFARRGAGLDLSKSEFAGLLKLEDIGFAPSYFKPFLEEEGHKNIGSLKTAKDKFKDDELTSVCLFEDQVPLSVESVYPKLYLLSPKKMPLRGLDLNGASGLLHNVAWSEDKSIGLEYLREDGMRPRMSKQYPKIDFVNKFPRFLTHVIPEDNIRILESSKVRMDVALTVGTTIMPGVSYVNFNAGTTGVCMVEGRISLSVIAGEGSDIGGGASILGVLSGMGDNAINVDKACLLGVNSATGMPLGGNCIIDVGIAVLEGTKFLLKDKEEPQKVNLGSDSNKEVYRGIEPRNSNALHFRQDSISGAVIVGFNKEVVTLNAVLH